MICVFSIFILLEGVNLDPKRHSLLTSVLPGSEFGADAVYLEDDSSWNGPRPCPLVTLRPCCLSEVPPQVSSRAFHTDSHLWAGYLSGIPSSCDFPFPDPTEPFWTAPSKCLTSNAGRAPTTMSSISAVAFLSLSPTLTPDQTLVLNLHVAQSTGPSGHYSEPQGLPSTPGTPSPASWPPRCCSCHEPVALCLGLSQSTRLTQPHGHPSEALRAHAVPTTSAPSSHATSGMAPGYRIGSVIRL